MTLVAQSLYLWALPGNGFASRSLLTFALISHFFSSKAFMSKYVAHMSKPMAPPGPFGGPPPPSPLTPATPGPCGGKPPPPPAPAGELPPEKLPPGKPPPPPPEPDEFGITIDDLIAYVSAVAATGLLAGIGQFLRRRGFTRTAKIFDKAQVGAEKIGGRKATEPGSSKKSVSREKQLEELGKSTFPKTTGRVLKASNEPVLLGVTPSNIYKAGNKIAPTI